MNPDIVGPAQLCLGDCVDVMQDMESNSIDIIVTSPPYWNQADYSFWPTYSDYLESVAVWVFQCSRVLKPGRHCFWVIPDKIPWPPKDNGTEERLYMPIYSDTECLAARCGLVPKFPIVWKKLHGSQKMFGSYPYPPTIIHTPMTERICVWRKPGKYPHPGKERKEASKFCKAKWVDWGQDLWVIPAETEIEFHPAPFPIELVSRILTLWSFVGDVVLDLFMGSGTTIVAAIHAGRNAVGIESDAGYYKDAKRRIENKVRAPSQIQLGDF